MDSTTLKIVSTVSILVPLAVNYVRLKQAGTVGRLFFLFLLGGLFTDVALWYVQSAGMKGISLHLFNAYAFLEALFFFWLIRRIAASPFLKKVAGYCLYITPVVGLAFLFAPLLEPGKTSNSIPFVISYEVAAAFLAGFALLSMAERDYQIGTSWEFWFMLGVFFYCFSTFFVMTLLGSQLSLNLWPLNNIINILTYLLFTVGWWKYRAVTN